MDLAVLERLLGARKLTLSDAMSSTPIEQLEVALAWRGRRWPATDLCRALRDRIAAAPRADFEPLKHIYFRHRPGR